jgi:hypothetical protein
MEDVIERLRASQREHGSELFEEGRQAGIEWAKSESEAIELRRLQKAWDSHQYGDETDWLSSEGTAHTEADIFVWQIRPDDRSRVGEDFFHVEVFGENDEYFHLDDEPEFIHGFAAGALEVWRQVASQL